MEFDTANHTKLWEAELPCSVLSSPAVYEDAVYFGSDTGVVYCINLK
jgi:outer membrane protein assembly factor BamB